MENKKSGWIKELKSSAIFGCIGVIVVGLIMGIGISSFMNETMGTTGEDLAPMAFLCALGIAVIKGFDKLTKTMVFANMAEDIMEINEEIQNKTDMEIKEKVSKIEPIFKDGRSIERAAAPKAGEWKCGRCEKNNPAFITRCSCGAAKGE